MALYCRLMLHGNCTSIVPSPMLQHLLPCFSPQGFRYLWPAILCAIIYSFLCLLARWVENHMSARSRLHMQIGSVRMPRLIKMYAATEKRTKTWKVRRRKANNMHIQRRTPARTSSSAR